MKHLKKTNKLLAALLAVILASGSLFTLPVTAAEPTTWWHDNAAAGFAGGTGTENDPYLKLPPHKEVFVCRRYCDRFWSQYLLLCYTASFVPLVLP